MRTNIILLLLVMFISGCNGGDKVTKVIDINTSYDYEVAIYKQTIESQSKGNRAAIEAYVIAGTDIEKETYINCMGGFMYD